MVSDPSRDGVGPNRVVQKAFGATRGAERIETPPSALASQVHLLEATLSSIPDFVCAFDRQRRFVYANSAVLALFALSADDVLGKTFADLDYPADLADRLNGHIDRILRDGATIEDEVFYRSPTGHAAYFSFLWGPVHAEDGSVKLVVGVSRDTTERRRIEEALRESEARLRAATELVGMGIYSWDPIKGALDWDERLRAMWGLPADAPVNTAVFEAGIHPDDLARVREAIAGCVDPAGDGRYNTEYRVLGRDDGVLRHIATAGQATFEQEVAVGLIGVAIDVTAQRRSEATIRANEALFRSFAEHSSNLIWIGDPVAETIIFRSDAYKRIWGVSPAEAPANIAEWMLDVHPDDRHQVETALAALKAGEVTHVEYRIIRPVDGSVRWLRDTSFPIPDEKGNVTRIGGITEDLTQEEVNQVYIVSAMAAEARSLAGLVRAIGHRAQTFVSASTFLDVAAVLAPGCVLVDLRRRRKEGLSILRELRARSIPLPTVALDAPTTDAMTGVAAMKAGATDYVIATDEGSLRTLLAKALAECHAMVRPTTRNEIAGGRVARLTPREREVLVGLLGGGTNKSIGQKLGISPRTVELHRAQVMNRLNAGSLTELLQIALAAGITPSGAH